MSETNKKTTQNKDSKAYNRNYNVVKEINKLEINYEKTP